MDRVTEITRECFDALIQVRRADAASLSPPALHQRLKRFISDMLRLAEARGFGREEAREIAYPVVALADELVQSRSEELRAFWATHALQLEFFGEFVAGEEFFTRLERLRADPRRRELLRAYHLALLLGFQGRFRVRGGELELLSIVEELQQDMLRDARFDADELSPRGERPQESLAQRARSSALLWVALGLLGLSGALYVGMKISLGLKTSEVVARIGAERR